MKVCSIFSQVLKLFSRGGFEKAVKQHKAERHARGFTSWGQFIAMLFCQVGRAHSLREICGGLACCEGHLKHFGSAGGAQEVDLGLRQWASAMGALSDGVRAEPVTEQHDRNQGCEFPPNVNIE
jgi:hypothetical protein